MEIARAMSNHCSTLICCLFVMLAFYFYPVHMVMAQTAPLPPVIGVQISPKGVLMLTDVLIDKTDKNAVLARNQAIIDAQRLAFQTLVQKSMSEEQFKSYLMPDDKTISVLVQDFEIKNEQISANRYVANFTVRFSADVADYIKSAGGTLTNISAALPLAGGSLIRPSTTPAAPLSVLVLPYFKNNLGKNILWEDPNPWREAWQRFENSGSRSGLTVTVPAGDIGDISFGSSDAVWVGDYSVLDKLKEIYKADVVSLAVAYNSDSYIQVDVYNYKDGRLDRKKSLPPYNITGEGDVVAVFQKVIPQVVNELWSLKSQPPRVENGLEDIESSLKVVPQQAQNLLPSPEHLTFDATMAFSNFAQWLEAQKRLSSISPSLKLNISSLSKDTAWFTIAADFVGGMEGFKTALEGKGLEMDSFLDPSSPERLLYTIRMN